MTSTDIKHSVTFPLVTCTYNIPITNCFKLYMADKPVPFIKWPELSTTTQFTTAPTIHVVVLYRYGESISIQRQCVSRNSYSIPSLATCASTKQDHLVTFTRVITRLCNIYNNSSAAYFQLQSADTFYLSRKNHAHSRKLFTTAVADTKSTQDQQIHELTLSQLLLLVQVTAIYGSGTGKSHIWL